jgi:O-acetyl-ADP-ribose deacetylase
MKIELIRDDITAHAVDAIVNPANTRLIPGSGIDGAIFRVGGPNLREECSKLIREQYPDGLTIGQAVFTSAGRLPASWVIHAVGPIFSKMVDRSEELIMAYRSALKAADKLGVRHISFPAISTGPYAYPPLDAARLALEATRFAKTDVELAEFVLLDVEVFEAFTTAFMELK